MPYAQISRDAEVAQRALGTLDLSQSLRRDVEPVLQARGETGARRLRPRRKPARARAFPHIALRHADVDERRLDTVLTRGAHAWTMAANVIRIRAVDDDGEATLARERS